MYRYYLLCLTLICIAGCRDDATQHLELMQQERYERFQHALAHQIQGRLPIPPDQPIAGSQAFPLAPEQVNAFYQLRSYQAAWTDTGGVDSTGQALISMIQHARHYGLEPQWYHWPHLDTLLQDLTTHPIDTAQMASLDILLTDGCFWLGNHLHAGAIDTNAWAHVNKLDQFEGNWAEWLDQGIKSKQVIANIKALQPQMKEYELLQKSLAQWLSQTTLFDDSLDRVPDSKDSIVLLTAAKPILMRWGLLDSQSVQTDSLVLQALRSYQEQHGLNPDFKIGRRTRRALNLTKWEHYQQVAITLERMRWDTVPPAYYLGVNIPGYELLVWQNGQVKATHKVIVGNPNAPTPEIQGEITYMITRPYWTVPRSIAIKEVIPNLLKDSTYLERKQFSLLNASREIITAIGIDWKQFTMDYFPYWFRKEGGPSNDLGLIKFIFPNSQMIFLHDTPNKSRFDSDFRAYSHGCVRVQNPIDLAALILLGDSNEASRDSLQQWVKKEDQTRINLNHPLPIRLRYHTTRGDSNGKLYFYHDVYGWNDILVRIFFNPATESRKAVS